MKTKNGLGSRPEKSPKPLSLAKTFAGARLVVIGGTGFLGKVWWVLMLDRYPDIERLYLMVRSRPGQTAEERFWGDIATSECLSPLREKHGEGFDAFLREKIVVLDGDITQPMCGMSAARRDALRGKVDAVINVSGIVDFQPPLDIALEVNAFGMQSLVQLARDLGEVPVLHTSTCYVAGYRTGIVEELSPLDHPFPYAGKLDPNLWDPDREIAECLDIIEQAKHRANDAFRESHFLDQAKHNLLESGEPAKGAVLEAEVRRVRRKFVEQQLAAFGQERAKFWGWPNTYTYTKSIGEQIIAKSKLPFTIVRPAIVESCVKFPLVGWNEGVNTSAPLIFAVREGQQQFPGAAIRLDIIPCDMVATGITLALGELLDGSQKAVYQFGTSDSNPTTMARIYELSGLYKRRHFKSTGRGGAIENFLQAHLEGSLMSSKSFDAIGPRAVSKGVNRVADWLDKTPKGPLGSLVAPTSQSLRVFARRQSKIADVVGQFSPFTADLDYEFRCDNTRSANARLDSEERDALFWAPEAMDWREWFLEVHVPGLERWVFPELERRLRKQKQAQRRHETLTQMIEELAERYDLRVALQRIEPEGLSRFSFKDIYERALACAGRLQAAGVQPGHRVVLLAENHPDWIVAFFGILLAGATVVPLQTDIQPKEMESVLSETAPKVVLLDDETLHRSNSQFGTATRLLVQAVTAPGPAGRKPVVRASDVAVLMHTSGTSARAKSVMLSHENLASLIAALAPLFPLDKDDRMLSVLPLSQPFELTCGMLLPLSRGARIVYLDEPKQSSMEFALREGRITAIVGVPEVWQMLEREIVGRVRKQGFTAKRAFDVALDVNRAVSKNLGLDLGRVLFGSIHHELGGHLKYLISAGASLDPKTQRLFSGLGLHLAEGYGLTEAAPVLSLSSPGAPNRPGQVGRAIPGVQLEIASPNEDGVGEVLAKGPNVMVGYGGEPEGTAQIVDERGFLHTGDLGKLDHKGRLSIVGRREDLVTFASGESVHPDEVEAQLGAISGVSELSVFGSHDSERGEVLVCVGVAEGEGESGKAAARRALLDRVLQLPQAMQPDRVLLRNEALPRSKSHRVKRAELRKWFEGAARVESDGRVPDASVREGLAQVTGRAASTIRAGDLLRGRLGCDAMMLLQLRDVLQARLGRPIDAGAVEHCRTVSDIETLLAGEQTVGEDPERKRRGAKVPDPLRLLGKTWLGLAHKQFYSQVMRTRVLGSAFLPNDRNVLVVANHSSVLDAGLVKFALGAYGNRLVVLARGESFDGSPLSRAFVDNFTNFVVLSPEAPLEEVLDTTAALLSEGKAVLLFPEGRRTTSGALGEFEPLAGAVALKAGVDVLPVWLGGTFEALPKGASVLRNRKLLVRIGRVLPIEELRRQTNAEAPAAAARKATALFRRAIAELQDGRQFAFPEVADRGFEQAPREGAVEKTPSATNVPPQAGSLEPVFQQLQERFRPGSLKRPVTYYLALGEHKYTMRLTPTTYSLDSGRTVENADCVVKTSPELFSRMVLDGYVPGAKEVWSGALKSNNVSALKDLKRIFDLGSPRPSPRFDGRPRHRSE